MVSRIGYHVQDMTDGRTRAWTKEEITRFWQHLERLQPTTIVFLDNREWALEAVQLLQNCRVILRRSYDVDGINESNMWAMQDADWHLDTFARDAEGGLALSLWNEPVIADVDVREFAERYADLMDKFGTRGIPIVGPNFAVGYPGENWMPMLEPMWQAFERWADLHDYGVHEYGTHHGMVYYQPDNPFSVFPYRVGRQTDLCTVPYLIRNRHVVPTMVFTEWGIDNAFDDTNYRGWRTCWDETRYAQELINAAHKVSTNRSYVRGFCVFTYGDAGQLHTRNDWSSYNVMEAFTLQEALELQYEAIDVIRAIPLRPAPTPTSEVIDEPVSISLPAPEETIRWKRGISTVVGGTYVNVRAEPTLKGTKIGKIFTSNTIFYLEEQIDGWWHVQIGNIQGYSSAKYLEIAPAPYQSYYFPFVLTLDSESPVTATRVANHLIDQVREEYQELQADETILPNVTTIANMSIIVND